MRSRVEEAGRVLAQGIQNAGGRALAVGGWVRDHFAGLDAKDLDLEVYGLPLPRLEELIRRRYQVDTLGKDFGVLRARVPGIEHPVDLVLPRLERRTGAGHRGFSVQLDPFLSPREAAHRRDLTLNAISLDLLTGELVDPWDGLADLRARRMRAVDPDRFGEDPLRVLRAAQFAARFELSASEQILGACRGVQLGELTRERVFDELRKLLLLGRRPSLGLQFLLQTGHWSFFSSSAPPLEALDRAAELRTGKEREDLLVALAVLASPMEEPEAFLLRLTEEKQLLRPALALLREPEPRSEEAFVLRLSTRLPPRRLAAFRAALGESELAERLMEQARRLGVEEAPPAPLVLGRHLLELGQQPGPRFKKLLAQAFEAQLDGQIRSTREGLRLLGLGS